MTLLHDLRYAWRALRKTPAFTFTAVATLGVAIGVNGAVFSLARAVLLTPLPYPHPDNLALIARSVRTNGATSTSTTVDGRVWEFVRDGGAGFDRAVFSTWTTGVNLAVADDRGTAPVSQVKYVQQQRVGSGYFRVLGVAPVHGREFLPEEDRPSGPPAVVLSHELWSVIYGGDPGAVGRSILLRGERYTVVGVMPPRFQSGERADVWTPLRAGTTGEGGGENYRVVVRYPDAGARAAVADTLAAIGGELQRSRPSGDQVSLYLVPLQTSMSAPLRQPILILWSAVAIVLIAACVNLAGVMLARTSTRAREIATRLALGSGRAAVIRQLLVEAGMIGALGGVAGIVIGSLSLDLLEWLARDTYEIWQPIGFGAVEVVAAACLAFAASLGFGVGPAVHAARLGTRISLAQGGRTIAGRSQHWPRRVLVVAQVALGVVLLTGAGLLVRTFVHLRNLDPGFDPSRLVTATISLEDARYRTVDSVARVLNESVTRIRATAGVQSAAASLGLPYQRLLNFGFRYSDGPDAAAKTGRMTSATYVTEGFFEAMRMPLRRGRSFDVRDRAGAPQVAIVNTAFAREYFRASDAVGRRIRISGVDREIVGIVGDVQLKPGWGNFGPLSTMPLVYVPLEQVSDGFVRLVHGWFQPAFVVRSALTPRETQNAIRDAVASLDPLLPLASFRSVAEIRGAALAEQRLLMTLLLTLSLTAVVVSAIGIHGLIATTVNERTRELGVRIALGSTAGAALRAVAMPGLWLAAAGTAVGLAAATAVTRVIGHFVWGVSATDPWTFAAVAAVLFGIAATASVLPARRILRLDPAITLRQE